MATLLRVPEVAAGATEVVLSEWLVEEGAEVAAGSAVVVVETEKAVVEIEAEVGGVVLRRLCEDGASIDVGSAYALVGAQEERDADVDALLAELGLGDPAQAETTGVTPAQTAVEDPAAPAPEAPQAPPDQTRRIFSAPVARRILAEAGIALSSVTGTGPNGRISKRDADEAVRRGVAAPAGAVPPAPESPAPEPSAPEVAAAPGAQPEPATPPTPASTPAPPGAGEGWTDEPHTRLRRAVAKRLGQSKQTVPHFYLRRTVRVDALLALRAQLNAVSPHRISVNDLVVRAVGVASAAVPEANVIWTDDALRRFDAVDVGIAVASPRGLVTPVVRSVDTATPAAIARRIRELVDQAADGSLRQGDLEGGCISVTNLGMYGVDEFAAIINPPQSAILAVGAAAPSAVVVDGEVMVATTMNLTLSVDHRAIDGALAARWMAVLVESLDEPLRLLA